MLSNIKSDFKVNYSTLSKLVCINYRLGNYAYRRSNLLLKVLYKLTNFITKIISNSDISARSTIGKSLRLEHGGQGVVIHSSATIGEDARIFHQTTIGIAGKAENEVAAVIGDNISFGAGAKIIGELQIGNDVKVGANTVVTKNLKDGSVVVGSSMRILNQEVHSQ